MKPDVTIALAGNPNCGKTALFNALTGSRQRVGNWPGVTVARMSGAFTEAGVCVEVIDLPGTYSLSVSEDGAVDERIACDFLHARRADLVVNVVDGSNLVRNLYLTLQLQEMNIPVLLVVNMMDIVHNRGLMLDLEQLAKRVGCEVVPLVASEGKGVNTLKKAILRVAHAPKPMHVETIQLTELLECLEHLAQLITQETSASPEQARWLALRLLEGDCYAQQAVTPEICQAAQAHCKKIATRCEEEADILIADARFRRANEIAAQVTTRTKAPRQTMTERLDKLVLHRWLGIPIFLGVMYLMFVFAINVGGAFQDFFDLSSTAIFVSGLAHLLVSWNAPAWLVALLANGVGKGINTIVAFAPVIGAMFLFLAFLEDCGYMARAAFVMDRFMQVLGLPGKSFVPMIVGFGCNVPAVMGARALSNMRDRILTVMMMPFMSCGARLAIFSVFASAFFPVGGALIIFSLYLIGILVAIISGLVLRNTLLPGRPEPLVMELPSYHTPRLGLLVRTAWHRLSGFLLRAGKYIIPVCVLLGMLNSVTFSGKLVAAGNQHAALVSVGRIVTPIFAPMGVRADNWQATVGLVSGVLAKEVVIGTLNSLYEPETAQKHHASAFALWSALYAAAATVPANLAHLGSALKNPIAASEPAHDLSQTAYGVMFQSFAGKIGAFAYLLFVLLYFPCISTMAAMRRELGQGWAVFSVVWSTGFAYCLAVMSYQLLTFRVHRASSMAWVLLMGGTLIFAYALLRWLAHPGGGKPTTGVRARVVKQLCETLRG